MTLGYACEMADRLAGNRIPMEQKVRWLSVLDGSIHREILQRHRETAHIPFGGYDGDTDPDRELLVPAPYDEIYRWFLEMEIFSANGELLRANNAGARYNSALLAYGDAVNRSCTPLGVRGLRLV